MGPGTEDVQPHIPAAMGDWEMDAGVGEDMPGKPGYLWLCFSRLGNYSYNRQREYTLFPADPPES